MDTSVLIVGAGEIGKAITFLLSKGGKSRVIQWDVDPAKNLNKKTLEELVPNADIVFICVPSRAVRKCMLMMNKKTSRRQIAVSVSKGIERESKKTVDGVLGEFLTSKQIVLLFGPMIAEEIMSGNPAAAVLACKSRKSAKKVSELFGDGFDLEYSSDVRGVALGGVMKNIYSIGLGIIHGLSLGTNFRGWYVAEASKETAKVLRMLGGKTETAYSMAGLGDLIATGFSSDSKNHMLGKDLALNGHSDLASEGSDSFPVLNEIVGKKIENLKILSALREIVLNGKAAADYFPKVINE
jgi:glycerol-3-phosphate dehydrogenase (NAD(P)+)